MSFNYRRLLVLLRREGVHANHKHIHGLYQLAGRAPAAQARARGTRTATAFLPSRPNESGRWTL
jgi:putative transposase